MYLYLSKMLFPPVLLFLGYFATYFLFHTQESDVDEERVVFDLYANITFYNSASKGYFYN